MSNFYVGEFLFFPSSDPPLDGTKNCNSNRFLIIILFSASNHDTKYFDSAYYFSFSAEKSLFHCYNLLAIVFLLDVDCEVVLSTFAGIGFFINLLCLYTRSCLICENEFLKNVSSVGEIASDALDLLQD